MWRMLHRSNTNGDLTPCERTELTRLLVGQRSNRRSAPFATVLQISHELILRIRWKPAMNQGGLVRAVATHRAPGRPRWARPNLPGSVWSVIHLRSTNGWDGGTVRTPLHVFDESLPGRL